MLSLAPPARAGIEGHIETNIIGKYKIALVTGGLDTSRHEHAELLDHRVSIST